MPWMALEPAAWAKEQFGSVNLGDKRLNRRVVAVATAMARDPEGSIPRQNQSWAGTKGAYRLLDHPQATFESLSQPHWQQTRDRCQGPGVVLMIQDTSWLDYSDHPSNQGMGWHGGPGKQRDRGLLLHSVLAVRPQNDGAQVLGVAWASLWAREGEPIGSNQQRRSRRRRSSDRESLRWTKAVNQIGAPTPCAGDSPARWLHVGDRESDIFGLFEQSQRLAGVGFVIRLKHDRNASAGHDTPDTLTRSRRKSSSIKAILRAMPTLGTRKLWIAPKGSKPGRWAELSVSGGAVTLWSPQLSCTGRALRCWAVRVWEAHPPQGEKAVEWMLLTSEPVRTLEDALRIAGYYTLRWLIEEYHQCLKSGCKVQERQVQTRDRLEPLIGMLCAVAARLLQLKNDARQAPELPATQCAPRELVQTLASLKKLDARTLTVRRFVHEVAKLGGFLGRKGDGEPGWRTLWQGWQQLELIHLGYQLARQPEDVGNA